MEALALSVGLDQNLRMDVEIVPRKRWSEEETILALYLYFQLPFGKLHSGNPEIQQLAGALGRQNNSVAMKLCNFASLDPKITESGRKGLAGASALDRSTYAQFGQDWDGLVSRAEGLLASRFATNEPVQSPARLKETHSEFRFEPYQGASTVQTFVNQRVGQGFFRRAVLANFEETCCITGIADPRLLIASHIMPWGKDHENRHNPLNGLLLSGTMDKAFDRGLISIDRDGRVMVSQQLNKSESAETRAYFQRYENNRIRSAARFDPDPVFLDWHNRFCFIDMLAD